jgi:hypothetical protein
MHSDATWFEKRAWLNICLDAGFETEVYKDEPRHQNGPAFSFLAMRKA